MLVLIDNGHGEGNGNSSPDHRIKEWAWCREIASRIDRVLTLAGVNSLRIVVENNDVSLSERIRRVNTRCAQLGAKNVLLVSVHINAAGNDSKWHDARGFSVFVSKNASSQSKALARRMTEYADAHHMTGNRAIPSEKFWTWSWTSKDIALLKQTNCPAVLTENFFMDNHEDATYLQSEAGKQAIVDLHVKTIISHINSLK